MPTVSPTIMQMMKLRPGELDRLSEKYPALVLEARNRQAIERQHLAGDPDAAVQEHPNPTSATS
jgi:hypothetical protein